MENPYHNYEFGSNPKRTCIEVNFANLSMNPYLRRKVSDYHPNSPQRNRSNSKALSTKETLSANKP